MRRSTLECRLVDLELDAEIMEKQVFQERVEVPFVHLNLQRLPRIVAEPCLQVLIRRLQVISTQFLGREASLRGLAGAAAASEATSLSGSRLSEACKGLFTRLAKVLEGLAY